MKGHGRIQLSAVLVMVLALIMVGIPQARPNTEQKDLAAIKANLEKRLTHDHILPENNVTVAVTDGTITLTGSVESIRQRREAGQDARHVERDFVVDNQLSVKESPMSDEQLQQEATKAINSSIFYGVFDWVTATAKNGTVTLEGVVAEPWHRGEIPRSVEAVKGVHEIVNRIQVLPPSVNDEEIRHAAARAIYHELYDESYRDNLNPAIHIVVYNGDVTLKGDVDSQTTQQEAENLVYYWTTAGSVTDDLQIDK